MDESHIGKTTEDKPQLEFVSKNEKQADLTLDDKGSFEQNFDFCFWLTVSLFFFIFIFLMTIWQSHGQLWAILLRGQPH